MSEVVVLGTSGHARSCLDVIATLGWTVRGCVGTLPGGPLQAKYLGDDYVLSHVIGDGVQAAVIAVGDNRTRRRLTLELRELGFSLPAVVSKSAFVSPTATLGPGCVVMHGAVVGPYTTIGESAIVNTGATVDHDCLLGDYVHVAPGAHLAGTVTIESGAFLGIGVSVIPAITIGEWAIVGAGAAVVRDIQSGKTVVGVPAHELSQVS